MEKMRCCELPRTQAVSFLPANYVSAILLGMSAYGLTETGAQPIGI
jgi:hypothetical protein